jgi:hypothetical protein
VLETRRYDRAASMDKARQSFDASAPREGRVMRAVRYCFIAGNGRPRSMAELVAYAYPKLKHYECWHRWSVRRAVIKTAKPIGRAGGIGRPGIWKLSGITEGINSQATDKP